VVVSAPIEQVKSWCQAANVDYLMLADPDHHVSATYGVHGLLGNDATVPSAFVIAADGQIVWYAIAEHLGDYIAAQTILENLP
jgi:peroxiredoxin